MKSISLKELLARAQNAEKAGNKREASAQFATIGIYLRKKNRPRDAKLFFKRAVFLSPTSPRLYIQLALCEKDLGDDIRADRAMLRFTKQVLRKKNSQEYRTYMEEHLQDYPRLRQIFYEAQLEVDRTDPELFAEHAEASIQCQDYLAAREMLVNAIKCKGDSKKILSKLRMVLVELQSTDELRALESFEKGKMPLKDLVFLLSESPGARAEQSNVSPETDDEKTDAEKDLDL